MSYRKFRSSQLFTGYELLGDQHVLITDEIGVIESIVPIAEAGDDVQFSEGILSPGFINCHCHLELSHLKGLIPENTGMTDFVLAIVQQRHQPEETIYAAMEAAENDMLKNGIVAVGDICNSKHSLIQKQKSKLYYHNFIETIGSVPAFAEERFFNSVSLFNAFVQQNALRSESNSIVPHAPYSVSPELFQRIINFPGNHLITMHSQESLAEEEFFSTKTGDFLRLFERLNIDLSFFHPSGKSSLQTVFPNFKKNQSLILVHNVTTNKTDLEYLKKNDQAPANLFFCLCPHANLYIGNGLPDLDLLQQSGYPVVLGTDSLASNHQLSILEEMKLVRKNYPGISIAELMRWATSNGARALRVEKVAGSFEKGKSPGVILFDKELSTIERLL